MRRYGPAGPGKRRGAGDGTTTRPAGWRGTAAAWAQLLRLPALCTVPGDALAGAASSGRAPNRGTALAVGSSLCLYEAGMALNDWADRETDARERPERPLVGVAVEAEDRGEVGLRRPGEAEAILLRARVRALVRADLAGAVLLDADLREEPAARARLPVGAGVVLGEEPERRLVVADDHAVVLPAGERRRRVFVRVAVALRQVDLDDVVRRAAQQLRALLVVDDVVGRSDDVREVSDDGRVEAESTERSDLGHGVLVGDLCRGRWWRESIVR